MEQNVFYENGASYNILDANKKDDRICQNRSESISPRPFEQYITDPDAHDDLNETLVPNDLGTLIKKWGFSDEIIEFLQSKSININTLKHMKERHLDELFPPELFSTKVIFESNLLTWKTQLVKLYGLFLQQVELNINLNEAIQIFNASFEVLT